jgi:hypothetical protein
MMHSSANVSLSRFLLDGRYRSREVNVTLCMDNVIRVLVAATLLYLAGLFFMIVVATP